MCQLLGGEMKKLILGVVFLVVIVILYLLNPLLAVMAAILGVFVLVKI